MIAILEKKLKMLSNMQKILENSWIKNMFFS
nr:MAG TPA: hypothetical protein [Caudoviricetes sp.]